MIVEDAARARASARPTQVRYRVLAAACALAIVTYVLRVGFSTASGELKEPLGLNTRQLGYLMAAFMVAYGIFEVPWGAIGDRLGVRKVLVIVALGGSATTAAVALVAWLPGAAALPFLLLLLLRFLFGAFQAGTFPNLARMMADWMPTTERGTAQGMIWTCSRLGGMLAPILLAAFFKSFTDWSTPLVIASGFGVVWCLGFWPWFRNRPEETRGVNKEEQVLIATGRAKSTTAGHGPIPWGGILKSRSAMALCAMYGCLGYSGNFFLTLLPDYLKTHRHLSTDVAARLTSIPFGAGIVACLAGGFASDWVIRKSGSKRWGRRIVGAFGMSLAGLAFISTLWTTDVVMLGMLLAITFFSNDLAMGPAWAAAADIGEEHTGTLSGAMNMCASFMAAVGALVAGHLFESGSTRLPFVLFAAAYGLGALCWLRVDVTETLGLEDSGD